MTATLPTVEDLRDQYLTLCEDATLASLPYRIETDAWGRILMSPVNNWHSFQSRAIQNLLEQYLGGQAVPEFAIATESGVRAPDLAWISGEFRARHQADAIATEAPPICVEVLSQSNTPPEMQEKRNIYFKAGAKEVWICDEDGEMTFYVSETSLPASSKPCPNFPHSVEA